MEARRLPSCIHRIHRIGAGEARPPVAQSGLNNQLRHLFARRLLILELRSAIAGIAEECMVNVAGHARAGLRPRRRLRR